MENPLTRQIEEILSRAIGGHDYKGKPVVLLEDAVNALEELEVRLWAICEMQINKIKNSDQLKEHQ